MGVLVKVLYISEGDVVEIGSGPASTPLLHWVCKDLNRNLITYENNQDYYNYARQFQSRMHRIVLITDWDDVDFKTRCGVVFVDHAPSERRSIDIINFKNSAVYLVIHDTEKEKQYGYEKIWPHFKYVYTWKECRPWVSVVSNFKDLKNLI